MKALQRRHRRSRAELSARTEQLEDSRQRIVAAQEAVRRDIAQHLHGSVQNRLLVLAHQLDTLSARADSRDVAEGLARVREELNQSVQGDLRVLTHRLYPSILALGLVPALEALVEPVKAVLPVRLELSDGFAGFERDHGWELPEQVRLAAYRIAEEALNNAVKHAGASRITVHLEIRPQGSIRLTVADDGVGLAVNAPGDGLGVAAMRDHAASVGGTCVLRSRPRGGTQVTAVLPLLEMAGGGAEGSGSRP